MPIRPHRKIDALSFIGGKVIYSDVRFHTFKFCQNCGVRAIYLNSTFILQAVGIDGQGNADARFTFEQNILLVNEFLMLVIDTRAPIAIFHLLQNAGFTFISICECGIGKTLLGHPCKTLFKIGTNSRIGAFCL